MSNQVYIPPINFNEFDNQTGSITSINAIEPLEYNKLNSNLSIKAATENNYGVLTTGDQNIRGNKNFINGLISEDAVFINLEITNGTITTEPTNNTDITNKGYIDNKTADMANYDISTNYLVSNKTGSNITNLNINSLNVSDNYINKEPNTVLVRARGAAGTFDKYITIYKSILNGKISIIFDKNLVFNDYSNVTDVSLREMIFNISDMSNISEIYDYLPSEFELTGEVSTYGGTHNMATKTLKFRKSPSDLYKYDLIYDKSFPFNIFKLKESIKNIDTVINTTEIQKINNLTIDKGYLINAPTEDNNLVNKSYVDTKANEINASIENAKTELNGNIESTKSELNGNITTSINNISNVNLTTGTISTTPTNDTEITNKKYVVDTINEVKNGLKDFIKYDNNNKNLYKSSDLASQLINDLKLNNLTSNNSTINDLTATSTTSENLISNDLRINNNLFLGSGILHFENFPSRKFVNSNSQDLIACSVMFLKIRVGGVIFINLKFDFLPFISDGKSIFMYGLPLSDIGSSYNGYLNYFSDTNDTNYIKCGRCQYFITKNSNGAYDIEIINTKNGDRIYQFDEIKRVFAIV